MSLADRFPRLRDRQLPQWLAEAPDDDTDLVQAARQSFADAVENLEGPEEVCTWCSLRDRLLEAEDRVD